MPDDTGWLEAAGFEVEPDGPPVGSYAIGQFGEGFALVRPDKPTPQYFDAAGREVSASPVIRELAAQGDRIIGEAIDADRPVEVSGSHAEPLDLFSGADVPDVVTQAVVEPPMGQEEAIESTALPERVTFRVESGPGAYERMRHLLRLPGRVYEDGLDLGIVHDSTLD